MNESKHVTAENLRSIRGAKDMNQAEIAELLGIAQTAVSKIEKGQRALSDSEKALLDWYFFGILPPRIASTASLQGCLEFTDEEWHVLGRMAARVGQTHSQFITATIRLDIHRDKEWPANAKLKVYENKAAEDPAAYRTGNGNGDGGK